MSTRLLTLCLVIMDPVGTSSRFQKALGGRAVRVELDGLADLGDGFVELLWSAKNKVGRSRGASAIKCGYAARGI